MSISYDPGLVEQVSYNLDLREPNQAALDALARALDTAKPGTEMIADLATGVGKTYIAGGLLDYLYESGIRNVVIVTPGSTIQRKTIDNLTAGGEPICRVLPENTAAEIAPGTYYAFLGRETAHCAQPSAASAA